MAHDASPLPAETLPGLSLRFRQPWLRIAGDICMPYGSVRLRENTAHDIDGHEPQSHCRNAHRVSRVAVRHPHRTASCSNSDITAHRLRALVPSAA